MSSEFSTLYSGLLIGDIDARELIPDEHQHQHQHQLQHQHHQHHHEEHIHQQLCDLSINPYPASTNSCNSGGSWTLANIDATLDFTTTSIEDYYNHPEQQNQEHQSLINQSEHLIVGNSNTIEGNIDQNGDDLLTIINNTNLIGNMDSHNGTTSEYYSLNSSDCFFPGLQATDLLADQLESMSGELFKTEDTQSNNIDMDYVSTGELKSLSSSNPSFDGSASSPSSSNPDMPVQRSNGDMINTAAAAIKFEDVADQDPDQSPDQRKLTTSYIVRLITV